MTNAFGNNWINACRNKEKLVQECAEGNNTSWMFGMLRTNLEQNSFIGKKLSISLTILLKVIVFIWISDLKNVFHTEAGAYNERCLLLLIKRPDTWNSIAVNDQF